MLYMRSMLTEFLNDCALYKAMLCRRMEYTRDTLIKFKLELVEIEAAAKKKGNESGFGGGFGGGGGGNNDKPVSIASCWFYPYCTLL